MVFFWGLFPRGTAGDQPTTRPNRVASGGSTCKPLRVRVRGVRVRRVEWTGNIGAKTNTNPERDGLVAISRYSADSFVALELRL